MDLTCIDQGLCSWCLTHASLQNVAHIDLVDLFRVKVFRKSYELIDFVNFNSRGIQAFSY